MKRLHHHEATWSGIPLRLAGDASGIRALLLGEGAASEAELLVRFPGAELLRENLASFDAAMAHLEDPRQPLPPLSPMGTAFQQSVWNALREIPRGQTTDYAALASRIDRPLAARAVAAACGANPIAILIPCHRVIRRDGGLSGYRWGREIKRRLLALEGSTADSSTIHSPARQKFAPPMG